MAIDFPSTPFVGQQITQSGTTWQWDGIGWNIVPVLYAAFASDTPPANPADNQQWWRATNGQLYFYYNDGNSKQWVQAAGSVYDDGYTKKTADRRNVIVNPGMHISQDWGSTAGNTLGYYPVDQWAMYVVGAVCSAQQVVLNTPKNGVCRIRKTVTTLKASLAATDFSMIMQPIEAQRISRAGFGTANALQLVARFGFKGPAGTYSFVCRNHVPNRSFIKNFTITAALANTDTEQTIVIPGDVTGTWMADATLGMSFSICDACGSSFIGVEGWQAGDFRGTAANSNMVATNGNVIELFDAGLYVDPDRTGVLPPYDVPDYADAMRDCSRYVQEVYVSIQGAAAYMVIPWYLQEVMRVTPTLVVIVAGAAANASPTGDGVLDNKGGYFQAQITATSGSVLNRKYRLYARM